MTKYLLLIVSATLAVAAEPLPIKDLDQERAMSRALMNLKSVQVDYEQAASKFNQANSYLGATIEKLRQTYNAPQECVPVMDLDANAPYLYKWQCPPKTQAANPNSSDRPPENHPSNVSVKVTPGNQKK